MCVCVRMCIFMCIFGFKKAQTTYLHSMFFTYKTNTVTSRLSSSRFFAKILRGQPLDPGLTAEIQPTAVEVWRVGVGGEGCRGSPVDSNQDSTPSSTNESLTDICYSITI